MLYVFALKFRAVNSVLVWSYALFNTMPFSPSRIKKNPNQTLHLSLIMPISSDTLDYHDSRLGSRVPFILDFSPFFSCGKLPCCPPLPANAAGLCCGGKKG